MNPKDYKDAMKNITTRPTFKESNGAWQRFIESEKLAEKKQKDHLKKLIKFGIEESSKPVIKNPVLREALEPKKQFNNITDRKKVAGKPINPKPNIQLNNPLSNSATDNFLELVDPGGWQTEGKRAGILEYELSDEYWRDQFETYQIQGGTLNFQQFMQQQLNNKISKKIDELVKEKKRAQGIAALIGETT